MGRASAYFAATAVLAAIAIVFMLVTFAATREEAIDAASAVPPPPLRDLFRMLSRNVPFLQIIAGIGCFSFADIVLKSGLVYYVRYYLGESEAVAGEAASLVQITITVMILPWTIVTRFIGKRWA